QSCASSYPNGASLFLSLASCECGNSVCASPCASLCSGLSSGGTTTGSTTGTTGTTGSGTGAICASCNANADCASGFCNTSTVPGFCDTADYCQNTPGGCGSYACDSTSGDCVCGP
ncbi:MAG: hypothetical protein JST54_35510, partial [Deltaproteobacteria bacterium]|nr:hypothetical protein [Deltaproteobacteria bacterium]